MRRFLFLAVFLLFLASLGVTSYLLYEREKNAENKHDSAINVVATFYPVAEFARQVGGPYVNVLTLVAPGSEPHEYEPTPQDMARIRESDGFLFLGVLDSWVMKILPDFQKAHVPTLDIASVVDGNFDPHIWLDPILVQKEVFAIRDFFVKIDVLHAAAYRANADRYVSLLQKLDEQYRTELASCDIQEVIVAHDAFSYLASQYHLKFLPIVGVSPEGESSAQKLATLTKIARERNIRFIYFESSASRKLSDTLASEVGAQTLVLNPLETLSIPDMAAGKDYISVMKENLHNLKRAYVCKDSK